MDLRSSEGLKIVDLVQELDALETGMTSKPTQADRVADLTRYMGTLRLILRDCLIQGEAEQAEARALHAVALFPECEEAHEALIHVYMESGRVAEAIRHLEKQHNFAPVSARPNPSQRPVQPYASSKRRRQRIAPWMAPAAVLVGVGAWIATGPGRHAASKSVPLPSKTGKLHTVESLSPPQALAMALTAYNDRADYKEAERLCDVALTQSRPVDAAGMAAALAQKGQAVEAQGDLKRAKQCYEEAMQLRRRQKEPLAEAHLLEMLSGLAQSDGDYAGAQQMLQESQTIRQREGDVVGVALCLRDRGMLAADQCRFEEAAARYRECLRLIAPLNKPEIEAHVHSLQGVIARDQGDFAQARTLIQGSLVFWQTRKHPRWVAGMKRALAVSAFYEGKDTESAAFLNESLKGYEAVGDRSSVAGTQVWLARVFAHQGNRDAATRLLQEALASQQERPSPLLQARLWEVQGEVLAQSHPDQAAALRTRAQAQRQKIHCPLTPVERLRSARTR